MFKQITHESLFYPIAVIKIKKKEKNYKDLFSIVWLKIFYFMVSDEWGNLTSWTDVGCSTYSNKSWIISLNRNLKILKISSRKKSSFFLYKHFVLDHFQDKTKLLFYVNTFYRRNFRMEQSYFKRNLIFIIY